MALRGRVQASASSWKTPCELWIASMIPHLQSNSHMPSGGEATSPKPQRSSSNRFQIGSALQAPGNRVPSSGRSHFQVSSPTANVLSCDRGFYWRNRLIVQHWRTNKNLLSRRSYGHLCRQSELLVRRGLYSVEDCSVSVRMCHQRCVSYESARRSEATGAVPPTSKETADEMDKENRSSDVTSDSGTDTESDEEGDDDNMERLEKAEREYLEALGQGDMVDLDLEQLEKLLGDSYSADSTVGTLYLKLGQEYEAGGEGPEQILRCGEKALKIFQEVSKTEDVKLEIGMALHLIGIAYVKMEKYEKTMPILEKALELFDSTDGEKTRAPKCAVRFLIGEMLSGMGKYDEALPLLTAAVAEQEVILGLDHEQLGKSYRKIAEVLAHAMRHEEALPYMQKALKINLRAYGRGSMDEAVDRRLLAVIYMGLEDHEQALQQHLIVRKILASSEHNSQTAFVDISTADTEITLGKFDDAITSLKTALSKVEKGSAMHAIALVNLAKAYERMKKPEEADKYAKEVLAILENKVLSKKDPVAVAEGYTQLAALYEKINQTESAIDSLKRANDLYASVPNQQSSIGGTQAQIGMLLFFTGKVKEAVPYLENAVDNLERSTGDQNFALGMVLNHLGVANVELDQLRAARLNFERAKFIFDEVLGEDHDDTIQVVRNLVNTNSLLDRLDDAIKYQEEIIRYLKKKEGDEAKEMLDEAVLHLQMLQEHWQSGKSITEAIGSENREYGRVISD